MPISYLKNNLWLLLLISFLVAMFFPQIGLFIKPVLVYLLMALMFFGTLGITVHAIGREFRDFKKIILTLCVIHILSPFLVFLVKDFFSSDIYLGLIIASCVSSGLSVVFLSKLYNADPADALVVTSISNLIAPIVIPVIVLLFASQAVQIGVLKMFLQIFQIVIVPFVLAVLIRKTKWYKPLTKLGSDISVIILFIVIIGTIAPVRDNILQTPNLFISLLIFVVVLTLINFILGLYIGKGKKEKIAFAITASYKNYTLALVLALSLFSPIVALPAIAYAVVNNFMLIPLYFFAKK